MTYQKSRSKKSFKNRLWLAFWRAVRRFLHRDDMYHLIKLGEEKRFYYLTSSQMKYKSDHVQNTEEHKL